MTQHLVCSRHRAIRGWSYALQDRKPERRETLDTGVRTFEVPDGVSLREAIAFITVNGWIPRDPPEE